MSSNGSASRRRATCSAQVAAALVARLQQVEQLGRDLVPAAPLEHAEVTGVDEAAVSGSSSSGAHSR